MDKKNIIYYNIPCPKYQKKRQGDYDETNQSDRKRNVAFPRRTGEET